MIERFATDEHIVRPDFQGGIGNRRAAVGDSVGFEKRAGLPARAIAEVGKKLVESAHGGKTVSAFPLRESRIKPQRTQKKERGYPMIFSSLGKFKKFIFEQKKTKETKNKSKECF
jgi:hypothetical protein